MTVVLTVHVMVNFIKAFSPVAVRGQASSKGSRDKTAVSQSMRGKNILGHTYVVFRIFALLKIKDCFPVISQLLKTNYSLMEGKWPVPWAT